MIGFGSIITILFLILEGKFLSAFFIFLFLGISGEFYRKKSYFKCNSNQIIWKFPGFENEKTIQLEGTNYKITSDWKGIVLKNETNEYSISLDGLWKNDKKHILKKLQEFYG
jgi:hypothetical protein